MATKGPSTAAARWVGSGWLEDDDGDLSVDLGFLAANPDYSSSA
jgi:hypothetical protein